ncbi:Nuclear pore protein NUP53 [Cladobotryum mycophilum]|uniref:Nuclear pore protein NUP53 n=1 Tax=Cladobotryum mycophilum TaxID=491253 RepID=A0ABR0SGL3_9HYPO
MAPLILHNVPDEECYVGEDGIKRPYAMIFNPHDGPGGNPRARRAVAETGSFGKSTRRSRSKTGTPARGRENPTLAAADKLFGDWVSNQANSNPPIANPRKANAGAAANSQEDAVPQRASVQSPPVELILRGYRSSTQQYAAIAHYESLAGRILEDYPREPPSSQRRYKSELRDPAFTRRRNLTSDERALVNRADGGEHWVKVTFESAEAGNAAVYASPQRILGHLVHAEPYRGVPPAKDESCPDIGQLADGEDGRSKSVPTGLDAPRPKPVVSGLPTTFSSRLLDLSPGDSRSSSQTMDTGTVNYSHSSSVTMTDAPFIPPTSSSGFEPMEIAQENSIFCRRIPTARKARLLPAEQALLPQQSVMQRFLNAVPIIKWFSGSMIGNEVPRTEMGEFDWSRASLYWKVIWWLDATFGLFKGDVYNIDKDD